MKQESSLADTKCGNRFPRSFSVFLVMFTGFVLAAWGITITSVLLWLIGVAIVFAGIALYAVLVM